MTVSQSPVVLLSVLLVGCTRSIERTEPKPLYPVHGAVVDSINGLPLPHARVGVAHGGSRTCRLPPINECLSTVLESLRFCFQRDATGSVQKLLGLSRVPHWWSYQAIPFDLFS